MSKNTQTSIAVLLFLIIVLAYIWGACVSVILWDWFLSQQFGLPQITITQAMGIGLIITTFSTSFARRVDLSDIRFAGKSAMERIVYTTAEAFLLPAFILGMGWIVRQFM